MRSEVELNDSSPRVVDVLHLFGLWEIRPISSGLALGLWPFQETNCEIKVPRTLRTAVSTILSGAINAVVVISSTPFSLLSLGHHYLN